MTDHLTPSHRSWNMSRISSKDTKPEMIVRKLLCESGIRGYRLHWKKVPGNPDICFPGRKIAIFIHGCFWHRHRNCKDATMPKSNTDFWEHKFSANTARDKLAKSELEDSGWKVITIWECEIKNREILKNIIHKEMGHLIKNDDMMAAEPKPDYNKQSI